MPDTFSGTAYSYIRFSSREQEQGDSIRRQRSLRDEWLAKHPAVTLDTTLGGEDRGVSAFRGRHRGDKHHLGRFLDAVRRGRVSRGSILLLESLDRLSREEEEEALALLLSLLNAGILVVQLEPLTVFRKGDGMIGLMRALIYLSRAREESAMKAARQTRTWEQKHRTARAEKAIVTARCPAWLEVVEGKFKFKPGSRDTLKRIFKRCLAGQGNRMIAADLHRDGVEHFEGGVWSGVYVGTILRNAAVVGRYQAMHRRGGKRVPNGPPVDGYFPAAVSLSDFHATQKARTARRKRGGRRGTDGWVALFAPVNDARTGERLHAILRVKQGQRYHVLQPAGVLRWQTRCVAFPLASFEAAIRQRLRELDFAEVFPKEPTSEETAEVQGQLADAEARRDRLRAAMVGGDEDETALPVLRGLDERVKKLSAELAELLQAEASPARQQWESLTELDATVANDPEVRLRYRAAAGRLIERLDVLIVAANPNANRRLAAVQIRFRESGAVRSYLILHKNAAAGRKQVPVAAGWRVLSWKWPAGIDLRKTADARELEQALLALDLARAEGE